MSKRDKSYVIFIFFTNFYISKTKLWFFYSIVPGPDRSTNPSDFMMLCMIVIVGLIMYALRPQSLRNSREGAKNRDDDPVSKTFITCKFIINYNVLFIFKLFYRVLMVNHQCRRRQWIETEWYYNLGLDLPQVRKFWVIKCCTKFDLM